MTVSMGMLIFAGLAYALEKDEPGTMFYTLPQVTHVLSRVTCHVSPVTPGAVLGDHHDDEHRLRGRGAAHRRRQVRGVAVRHLRRALHHPAHPHHCGQLQQVSG